MSDWLDLKNSLDLSLRPIDQWPGKPRYDRELGPFSAPLKDTQATLKREMSALSAKDIVLQIALREQDLRQDGLPRANAIATHPGVILAFDSKHGPLRLYFDRFTKWQNNLRAVAMHLEHLRLAGLYGVGTDGQQYKGWQALPAPPSNRFTSAQSAAVFLAQYSDWGAADLLGNSVVTRSAYNAAAIKLHPDTGGDHKSFLMLQQAKELLDKHHRRG